VNPKNDTRTVQPYLFFEGRCEEALEFYRKTLGAEITALVHFKDIPDPNMRPPGAENKIMHASFRIGESTVSASDGRCQGSQNFRGFSLSLNVPNEGEAEQLFAALAEGGRVQVPLGKTAFAARFGMVEDRMGVSWTINVAAQGKTS
jgi:PhnB protein